MKGSKQRFMASLPIHDGDLVIREWTREDVDRRAAWPPYQAPYSVFTSSLADMDSTERDAYFQSRDEREDRITLTVDLADEVGNRKGFSDRNLHAGRGLLDHSITKGDNVLNTAKLTKYMRWTALHHGSSLRALHWASR